MRQSDHNDQASDRDEDHTQYQAVEEAISEPRHADRRSPGFTRRLICGSIMCANVVSASSSEKWQ